MEGRIALALVLLVCANMTHGHPAAQFSPFQPIANQRQYLSAQVRNSLYAHPEQPFAYASAQPSTCSCAHGGGPCPHCARALEQPLELSIGEMGIPVTDIQPRFVRSMPVSSSPADDNDSSIMKLVRSALLAAQPFFEDGELRILSPQPKSAQREIPIDNLLMPAVPISDIRTPKMQPDNSPAHSYGMCYTNVRVQSFDTNPDDECDKGKRADAEERRQASKERKMDEQQGQIMVALEQLSQGQIATMMAQLDAEMMAEQEFSLQESYLREIKHQLNSLRAAGEARDKVKNGVTVTPVLTATTEKGMSDSQFETTTSIDETPDTTTASIGTGSTST